MPAYSIPFRIFLLLVLLSPAAAASAEILTVATFNVRNYLVEDRVVDGRWRPEYPKPEIERDAVRAVITRHRPDVLVLQEMGDGPFLEELRRDLKADGLVYRHAHLVRGADESRHLALLSQVPFRVVPPADIDFKYFEGRLPLKRGYLEAHFHTAGQPWVLFGVHLKSRYTDDSRDPESARRRTREAQTLRDYIREQFPPESGPSYLVVGDFNDTRGQAPIRRFLEVSDTVLTEAVPAVDSRGESWTHYYRREDVYSRVDFILASPAMLQRYVPESGRVVDDPEALVASDHRMVLATFRFE